MVEELAEEREPGVERRRLTPASGATFGKKKTWRSSAVPKLAVQAGAGDELHAILQDVVIAR